MSSERQIEAANLLSGVDPEVVDAVVAMVAEAEQKSAITAAEKTSKTTEDMIRLKLLDETDWRKRASLSALLISRSLE